MAVRHPKGRMHTGRESPELRGRPRLPGGPRERGPGAPTPEAARAGGARSSGQGGPARGGGVRDPLSRSAVPARGRAHLGLLRFQ